MADRDLPEDALRQSLKPSFANYLALMLGELSKCFSPFGFYGFFLFPHRVKEQTTFNRKVKTTSTNNPEEPKAAPAYQNLVRLVDPLSA